MFVTMAFHYPTAQHEGDFRQFMKAIEDGMEGTPGLLSLESYRDAENQRLVAIGRWNSPADAGAGVSKLISIGERQPEWTHKPDKVFQLTDLHAAE